MHGLGEVFLEIFSSFLLLKSIFVHLRDEKTNTYDYSSGGSERLTFDDLIYGNNQNQFTVRYNGYLDMRTMKPSLYTIALGGDDTAYFKMDTSSENTIEMGVTQVGQRFNLLPHPISFPLTTYLGKDMVGNGQDSSSLVPVSPDTWHLATPKMVVLQSILSNK
jgi:hypothetical protein